jgi:hypothetical protein
MENGMLFFTEEPESPGYPCSNRTCEETFGDESEMNKCEGCGVLFCGGCLLKIAELEFCESCAICRACGKQAANCCDECGDLLCDAHAVAVDDLVFRCTETGYRETGRVCRGGCSVTLRPADVVAMKEAR